MMPIRIELEEFSLNNLRLNERDFASGGSVVEVDDVMSSGLASTNFSEESGIYNVVLAYHDENDGESRILITIGNNQTELILNQDFGTGFFNPSNLVLNQAFDGLFIDNGTPLRIEATPDANERIRIDYIELIPLSPGELAFKNSEFTINEDGTPVSEVTLIRINGSDGQVSVSVSLTDGTAIAPGDYDSSLITVTFQPGETEKRITIPIVDDTVNELPETINLSLLNPSDGVTLGTQSTAQLFILDNDNSPRTPDNDTSSNDLSSLMIGTPSPDTLCGTPQSDILQGKAGEDLLKGKARSDLLRGGRGSDTLKGGSGSDILRGGRNDDLLRGGSGNDILRGGRNDDLLRGGSGKDILIGGRGSDRLIASLGNDILKGGTGDDTLIGGRGNDQLTGNEGNDELEGGKGADSFIIRVDSGFDRVIDFQVGQDIIVLSRGLMFNNLNIIRDGLDTIIANEGKNLLLLKGVDAMQLTQRDFT